jgi:hypothetical protein
VKRLH